MIFVYTGINKNPKERLRKIPKVKGRIYLPDSLKQSLQQIDDYQSLISFIIDEGSKLEKIIKNDDKTIKWDNKQEYKNQISHYAKNSFEQSHDYESSFKAYGILMGLDPLSLSSHHFLGHIMDQESLFNQSRLLFQKGLEYSSERNKDSDVKHIDFHGDIFCLLGGIFYAHISDFHSISKYGFDVKKEGFDLKTMEKFYYTHLNSEEFDIEGIDPDGGCLELGYEYIHYRLGDLPEINGKPHTSDNCPYLDFIRESK